MILLLCRFKLHYNVAQMDNITFCTRVLLLSSSSDYTPTRFSEQLFFIRSRIAHTHTLLMYAICISIIYIIVYTYTILCVSYYCIIIINVFMVPHALYIQENSYSICIVASASETAIIVLRAAIVSRRSVGIQPNISERNRCRYTNYIVNLVPGIYCSIIQEGRVQNIMGMWFQ